MLDRIQGFFQSLTSSAKASEFAEDDIRVSLAALCFQVIEADGLINKSEVLKLRSLIETHLELDQPATDRLMKISREAAKEAVDYYRFTSEVRRHLTPEQCQEFVSVLWDIVNVDGNKNEIEDHVIWRISDLLGVESNDS